MTKNLIIVFDRLPGHECGEGRDYAKACPACKEPHMREPGIADAVLFTKEEALKAQFEWNSFLTEEDKEVVTIQPRDGADSRYVVWSDSSVTLDLPLKQLKGLVKPGSIIIGEFKAACQEQVNALADAYLGRRSPREQGSVEFKPTSLN